MLFSEACHEMVNKRAKIKLPYWDGYWEWDRNLKSIMNCIKGNRTSVSCDSFGVMLNIPTDKWMIVNEENKEMENTYVTNNLTCKAVQLKDQAFLYKGILNTKLQCKINQFIILFLCDCSV